VENNQLFATPVIWYPGQSEVDFYEEIELMLVRAQITADFLQGGIHPDTFLDFLDEQGFDVFEVSEDWQLIVP
jgi:hypothetical protein